MSGEAVRPGRGAAQAADEARLRIEEREEKPFRLVKSFSAAAIVLILATVMTLAVGISRQAEKIISTRVEDDTNKLLENLNRQLYYDFLVPAQYSFGRVQLRDPEQQTLLSEVISRAIRGFDLKRVILYDQNGEVAYATDGTAPQSPPDDPLSVEKAIGLYSGYDLPDPRSFLPGPAPAEDYPAGDYPAPAPGFAPAPETGLYDPPLFFGDPESRRQFEDFLSLNREARPGLIPDEARFASFWSWLRRNSPAAPDLPTGETLLERLRSRTVHRYEGGRYLFLNFFPRGDFVLRSYRAMENYRARGLSGVLELDRDLTPEYRQIARLQYFALGAAMLLALILTLTLRWVVSRGEAALTRRNLERQALRQRLNQAERLAGLGGMVATVAHEIRNPLGIIHSAADVLSRFLSAEPDKARLAGAIMEEVDRLSAVVTEFLDFARPPEPKLAPVSPEEILEEVLASLEVTLTRASVELRTGFRTDPAPIPADGPMLHRAFLNILINAVQAMPGGGLLTVSTWAEPGRAPGGGRLWVAIRDTGPGLSAEAARKVFDPFFTTKAKGTGLGLVIVRNIIEAHGGEIELAGGGPPEDPGGETGPGLTVRLGLKM